MRSDPNRTAYIALLAGERGKRWVLATENIRAGQVVSTTCHIPANPIIGIEGNAYPLGALAEGSIINSIEKHPSDTSESFIVNAGSSAEIVRHSGNNVIIRVRCFIYWTS